jgi:SAM-dependent methyltransferase
MVVVKTPISNRIIKMNSPQWPKKLPELSPAQQVIRDDFMQHWLEVLPNRFGMIEQFNHRYPLRTFRKGARSLEIGAGIGAHLRFEDLQNQEYVALELRCELAQALEKEFPLAKAVTGDCQKRIEYPDEYFNRILAIHVLEHLPDLPAALVEIKRIMRPDGLFSVLIPCDPGFAYSIARSISARRIFEKRYKQSYDWLIKSEHINAPQEILFELKKHYTIVHQLFFPSLLPINDLNLVIGLTLEKRKE